eukprot:Nk52_evm25s207 gene=Nk52_evmTU25s207
MFKPSSTYKDTVKDALTSLAKEYTLILRFQEQSMHKASPNVPLGHGVCYSLSFAIERTPCYITFKANDMVIVGGEGQAYYKSMSGSGILTHYWSNIPTEQNIRDMNLRKEVVDTTAPTQIFETFRGNAEKLDLRSTDNLCYVVESPAYSQDICDLLGTAIDLAKGDNPVISKVFGQQHKPKDYLITTMENLGKPKVNIKSKDFEEILETYTTLQNNFNADESTRGKCIDCIEYTNRNRREIKKDENDKHQEPKEGPVDEEDYIRNQLEKTI